MEEDKLKRANELSKLIKVNENSINRIKTFIKEGKPLKSIGIKIGAWSPILLTLPNLEKSLPLILINSEEELKRLKKEFEEL